MTRDDVVTMQAALDRYISDLAILTHDTTCELERARELRDRTTAALDTDPHVRDEDLVPEVVRPGDLLRVSTAILKEWIDQGGPTTVAVLVKRIERSDDGTKVVIVSAPMVNG